MSPVTLVRTVRFSAGHRYRRPEWSEERNRRTFGRSVSPHGHNYALDVAVRGEIDGRTGFAVDLAELDALLRREVVERLDQRDLTEALPAFRDGGRIPTTEELARWFFHHLADRIPGSARLVRVRLRESETLAAEYAPDRHGGA